LGGFFFEVFLFRIGGVDFSISFLFDYVSLGFFSCVSFISGLVFLYSVFYIEGTVDFRRFFWLVFGFVLSIFFLVFSGNFFLVMVGWDGLGLISFCLVIFYSNHSRLESGLVTVFRNRVGDVFFLVCFFFFFLSGSFFFDSGSLFNKVGFFIFLFLGAITKRAQLPFSAWLPAAIAAPTPVSSLVHSSTLVTAGVYVLIRFSYIFFFLDLVVFKLIFVLTILVAGVSANLEKDFKKVVAISTLSQLGLILFVLSVGVWVLSFLHMIIHAFFKSMLFLRTGSLMSHLGGNQDSRFYGRGIFSFFSILFFLVRCVCLSGFPFFIGFYSKDFIILGRSVGLGLFFYFSFLVGCFFTVLYRFRLFSSGYSSLFKGYSLGGYEESFNFLVPTTFLFFKA
jgi:NADH-ubiquinone oxidoreductase chain 5